MNGMYRVSPSYPVHVSNGQPELNIPKKSTNNATYARQTRPFRMGWNPADTDSLNHWIRVDLSIHMGRIKWTSIGSLHGIVDLVYKHAFESSRLKLAYLITVTCWSHVNRVDPTGRRPRYVIGAV